MWFATLFLQVLYITFVTQARTVTHAHIALKVREPALQRFHKRIVLVKLCEVYMRGSQPCFYKYCI